MPAGHVYVRHIHAPDGSDGVRLLPDPRPNGAPSTSQQWWPPVMLDPAWIDAHHTAFDVYHLHFGFDAQTPQQLAALVGRLRRYGKPLVQTVHDLRNPHHPDRRAHDAALDVLIPAADCLITLTPGAAAEISSRWGRTAHVLPHPHVVDEPALSRPRGHRAGFVVGVHAKSLRPNMAPLQVVTALTRVVPDLPGAVLQVDIHRDTHDPAAGAYAPEVVAGLRALAGRRLIDLRVHDYFDDDALWTYLQSLDLSVLPYTFGTHSGWLEACHDLGTAVAAPDCGFYAQQRPCHTYGHGHRADLDGTGPGEALLDEASLHAAVRQAYAHRPAWRAHPPVRAAERQNLAAAHRALYEACLS
ncbi:glycosyltransferase family 1 protein [Streptomyces bambusae]|uniref:glycosyltransferase family 1 protein n=1 Tax=Streptomyces bambusae TaxID=1550616 RepID=UPI001CFF2E19|nr:glycosyltransferase family 1 protein [Streptomyces bambusae]MCB5166498.1 glycosyltransferase family 1 protein [Streptomyces bambusae]